MEHGLKRQLLLGTRNSGKVRELRALLAEVNSLQLVSMEEAGVVSKVEETGETYAENAALKARAYAEASGMPALADDSGLEVDALDGAPGLRSARYSPKPGATDADRRAYLLQQLEGLPRPWKARFRATVAVALPGGETRFAEGTCEGEIIPQERGTGGFGYDPIFLVEGTQKTMAELSEEEKNRVSHRARAMEQAKKFIVEMFS